MYRVVERGEVLYGHYRQFLEIFEQMVAMQHARGWRESSLWSPTVGKGNEVITITDYPDLATFQSEADAVGSDVEFMNLFRSTAEHMVQGSVHSELLEPAPRVV
jgi:hypothetical protein